jgi:hypothetical protein
MSRIGVVHHIFPALLCSLSLVAFPYTLAGTHDMPEREASVAPTASGKVISSRSVATNRLAAAPDYAHPHTL